MQYGLIAEEVDQVVSETTLPDKDGQIQTVAYQLLPPMLLNEAQKQRKTLEALQSWSSALRAEVDGILTRLPKEGGPWVRPRGPRAQGPRWNRAPHRSAHPAGGADARFNRNS